MKLVEQGAQIIKFYEGCKLKAYLCPANIWTIGYGHTGPEVVRGLVITQEQAEQLFLEDTKSRGKVLAKYLGKSATTDNQFSAMLSLMYNIGNKAFKDSTVLKKHLEGDVYLASMAFLMWVKATVGGKKVTLNGLVARRKVESGLYLS